MCAHDETNQTKYRSYNGFILPNILHISHFCLIKTVVHLSNHTICLDRSLHDDCIYCIWMLVNQQNCPNGMLCLNLKKCFLNFSEIIPRRKTLICNIKNLMQRRSSHKYKFKKMNTKTYL